MSDPRSRFAAYVPARSTVLIDGPRQRTTEWRFPPGAHTGWHRHGMDYVVVPLTTGDLLIADDQGERRAGMTAGVPYERTAGVEHDVANPNDFEFVFLEIELR